MNSQRVATVVVPPDADGWGAVTVEGAVRQCYFLASRFPTINVGDGVTVESMGAQLNAVHRLRAA